MESWQRTATNVVRGGLIGTVEVVPGVSGGTVALIVGIYETIITSAGHILTGLRHVVTDVPRGLGLARAREQFGRADWSTLLPVAAGMLLAVVLVARQMEGFVQDHPELARGLFLGLVGAAVAVPISMVGRRWNLGYAAAAVAAAAAAFVVTGLPPTEVTPSRPIILLAAAVAVCALVLPGVSGSFILLTVGLYEPTLAALNDRDLGYLVWFVIGLLIGLALFVRTMQWLLEQHRTITLAVLTGVMAGCMRALWPWQDDDRQLLAPGDNVGSVLLLFVLGAAAVGLTLLIGRRAQRPRRSAGVHARR
jgi:putative membrane protein